MCLKINLLTFFFWLIGVLNCGFAQQLPQYSQYMFNPYLINPAYAGSSDDYHLNAGFRQQWVGVDGAPVTFYASGHGHVGKDHIRHRNMRLNQNDWHHGFGFMAYADKTGGSGKNYLFNTYKFYATYAYDMSLAKNLRVSFAASLGVVQVGIDKSAVIANQEVSSTAFNNTNTFIVPDANVGVFIYHKLWYVGASNYQLFAQRLRSPFESSNGLNYLTRQYFFTSGGLFRLHHDPEIDLIPSTLIKLSENVVLAPITADFNAKVTFKQLEWGNDQMIWSGISYRTLEGLVFMIGLKFNKRYEIGYSYDYALNKLQTTSRGSHEFMVGYRIIQKQKVLSPSDFWD